MNTIGQIPEGRVATYGQIALLAGKPGAARSVGRVLRKLPNNTALPWHRVLNTHGKISIPHQGATVQQKRLESEGVVFLGGRVSLKDYQWIP